MLSHTPSKRNIFMPSAIRFSVVQWKRLGDAMIFVKRVQIISRGSGVPIPFFIVNAAQLLLSISGETIT